MNVLASECSSGCESGWTLYLEHSFSASHRDRRANNNGTFVNGKSGFCNEEGYKENDEEENEEEDQSMVSDASSGPPHFPEDEVYSDHHDNNEVGPLKLGGKRQRIKEKRHRTGDQQQQQQLPSFLDDTASSPVFNFPKNNFIVSNNQASQGFSSTRFEGRSAYQDNFGFLQSNLSGNKLQDQNQWFKGRGWE